MQEITNDKIIPIGAVFGSRLLAKGVYEEKGRDLAVVDIGELQLTSTQ